MKKPILPFVAPASPVWRPIPPSGTQWRHEVKFDGWRVQARKNDTDVIVLSHCPFAKGRVQWTCCARHLPPYCAGRPISSNNKVPFSVISSARRRDARDQALPCLEDDPFLGEGQIPPAGRNVPAVRDEGYGRAILRDRGAVVSTVELAARAAECPAIFVGVAEDPSAPDVVCPRISRIESSSACASPASEYWPKLIGRAATRESDEATNSKTSCR